MQYVFLAAVVGLLGALLVSEVGKRPLPAWLRATRVVLLIAPIPFLIFGFAATFEPGPNFWIWRIVYAVLVLGCLAGVMRLSRPRHSN